METIELCNKDQAQIMKGKRTKRPRLPSPLRLTMASTSSSPGRTTSTDNNNYSGGLTDMATSSTDHHQLRESTEEEEDMANCLILLAQGHTRKPSTSHNDNNSKASSGLYLYQCKTCERCFPSFQALGGHRASHKKPRSNTEGKLQAVGFANEEGARHDRYDPTTTSTTLSLQLSNGALHSSSSSKSKVHECSICGAEFSSGQALGGHMRRHRTFVNNCTTSANTGNNINGGNGSGNSEFQEAKKPRNVLKLDLNLPAPDDDHRESKLSFPSKENVLVFSASSLVDCHY